MNEEKKNNNKVLIIVLSVIGGLFLLGFIGMCAVLLFWNSIQKTINNQWNEMVNEQQNQWDKPTKEDIDQEYKENKIKLEKTIDGKAIIYFFRGEGCSHCAEAEAWFESIEPEYGDYFKVIDYETWYNKDNAKLMQEVAKSRGEEVKGVPYIIIGNKSWNGFTESYEQEIINELKTNYNN